MSAEKPAASRLLAFTSVAVVAEISLGSPRKLYIFYYQKNNLSDVSIQKINLLNFEKKNHWPLTHLSVCRVELHISVLRWETCRVSRLNFAFVGVIYIHTQIQTWKLSVTAAISAKDEALSTTPHAAVVATMVYWEVTVQLVVLKTKRCLNGVANLVNLLSVDMKA